MNKMIRHSVSDAQLAAALNVAAIVAAGMNYRMDSSGAAARIVNFAIDLLEEIEARRETPPKKL